MQEVQMMSGKKAVLLGLVMLTIPLCAARAPWVQNRMDLEVMTGFISKHSDVAAGLLSIDFVNFTVNYRGREGRPCKAVFERSWSFKLPGWVGPADPLEFKTSNCELRSKE
jgi:hypothetical protein